MNNEIATNQDQPTLDILPPAQAAKLGAVAMLRQHAEVMQLAYEFASRMVTTDLVPARYKNKPDDATAAVLYGAELGLNPGQALQNVFSVHGSPAVYARTMHGLLKARGYRFRTIEKTSEVVEIHGWEPGRDPDTMPPDETARWTIEDAERAKYTSNTKYQSEPRAMLYAKALAEVCRHLAPDVLLGISYSVEELRLERFEPRPGPGPAPITVEEILQCPQDPPAGPKTQTTTTSAEPAAATLFDETSVAGGEPSPIPPAAEPSQAMTTITRRKWSNRMFQLLDQGDCTDKDDQLIVMAGITGVDYGSRAEPTDTELRTMVNQLNDWSKNGTLGQQITELLNQHAINQTETQGE